MCADASDVVGVSALNSVEEELDGLGGVVPGCGDVRLCAEVDEVGGLCLGMGCCTGDHDVETGLTCGSAVDVEEDLPGAGVLGEDASLVSAAVAGGVDAG